MTRGKVTVTGEVPVSVIMLTYNRKNFVRRAIESVLAQTMRDLEFIIVDNGSDDGSGDICTEYLKQDERVKLITRHKGSISAGRNDGLALMRGRYTAFIDDDDYAEPDMMDFLYQLAETNGADIAVCGSLREMGGVFSNNFVYDEQLIMSGEEAVIDLCERKHLNTATPTKMFKSELFNDIRFDESGKYDDISTVYKLFAKARTVVLKGTPKYCFYRHTGNNSGFTDNDKSLTPKQLDEYFRAYDERTAYLSEKFPNSAGYFKYSHWSFLISMYNKITTNDLRECDAQKEYAYSVLEENYEEFFNSEFLKGFEREHILRYFK